MGKERGHSPHKTKHGGRTESPSHRFIDLSNTDEGKQIAKLGQDNGGVESLLEELRHTGPPGKAARRRYKLPSGK